MYGKILFKISYLFMEYQFLRLKLPAPVCCVTNKNHHINPVNKKIPVRCAGNIPVQPG
jgi:hypothetical protein